MVLVGDLVVEGELVEAARAAECSACFFEVLFDPELVLLVLQGIEEGFGFVSIWIGFTLAHPFA